MKKLESQSSQSYVNSSINAATGSTVNIENFQTAETITHITNNITPASVATKLPLIWGTMPLENQNFYESSKMRTIHDSFEEMSAFKILVVTGLGGVGKTELVKNYFYRTSKKYNAKIWFNADSRNHLESEFRMLAIKLNLSNENEAAKSN